MLRGRIQGQRAQRPDTRVGGGPSPGPGPNSGPAPPPPNPSRGGAKVAPHSALGGQATAPALNMLPSPGLPPGPPPGDADSDVTLRV